MIEPLRYNKEVHPAYEIARPVFCHACLCQKNSRLDPNIAVKYCSKCPTTLDEDKQYGAFLCKECDDKNHRTGPAQSHVRPLLVVGPGVRKKVVVRGDGVNFPLPLDHVTISVRSKVYQNGRRVHNIRRKEMSFVSGLSGRCLHVQMLGARNLLVGDAHGSSDPYVVYSFCGKPLGTTRVRPRSTNPRWDNETFIVPMDENLPPARDMPQSQKDLIRFEVYDHDWVSQSEFLGHVEITRSKLMKIAAISNQQPIRLPLTMKEYHGFVNLQFGFDEKHLFVKANRAENLNIMDARYLSNPYMRIYLGNSLLIGTTSTIRQTINPQWESGNVFKIKLLQLLFAERYALSQIDAYNETQKFNARGSTNNRGFRNETVAQAMDEFANLPTNLALFRIELYHENRFRQHHLLGKAYISVHKLRKMLPTLPAADIANLNGYTDFVRNTVRADQLSAKNNSTKAAGGTIWKGFGSKKGQNNNRLESPSNSRPASPGPGAPSGSPPSPYKRRGNLMGAAPSTSNAPVPSAPPAHTAAPAITTLPAQAAPQIPATTDLSGLQAALESAMLAPPSSRSNRPQPPPLSSNSNDSAAFPTRSQRAPPPSLPGLPADLSALSSRRRSPLAISTDFGSLSTAAPAGLGSGSDRVETPVNLAGAAEVEDTKSDDADQDEQDPATDLESTAVGRGATAIGTPLSADIMSGDIAVNQMLPSEKSKGAAYSYSQRSTRPTPPPMPMPTTTESHRSTSGFGEASDNEDEDRNENNANDDQNEAHGGDTAGAEVPDTADLEEGGGPSAADSANRAPFLKSSVNSSSTLVSRKSKRSLFSSFRGLPETTWSESYPFPVMLDLTAHKGVDTHGTSVSQGFLVLRLIPATRGTVLLGLDEAVRQMTVGETAQVKCRYDYAYGSFSMGSSIPPRANVIFKVTLLEINGHGRWAVFYRMFIRFFRWFWRFLAAVQLYFKGEEEIKPTGKGKSAKSARQSMRASRKLNASNSFSSKLMSMVGLSSRGGTAGSDSESEDSEDELSEEEDDELLGGDVHEALEAAESDDGGSSVDSNIQAGSRPRVKPDPKMRKHLNQSVQSGAQIMWNFKPPVKVKRVKSAAKKPLYGSKPPLVPVREQADDEKDSGAGDARAGDLVAEGVTDDEGPNAGYTTDEGDNNRDDEAMHRMHESNKQYLRENGLLDEEGEGQASGSEQEDDDVD